MYKDLKLFNNEKMNKPIKNWDKGPSRESIKEKRQMYNK